MENVVIWVQRLPLASGNSLILWFPEVGTVQGEKRWGGGLWELSMLNKSVTKVVTFVEDRDEQGCLPFSHSYTALCKVSMSARRLRSSPVQSGRQGQADFFFFFLQDQCSFLSLGNIMFSSEVTWPGTNMETQTWGPDTKVQVRSPS